MPDYGEVDRDPSTTQHEPMKPKSPEFEAKWNTDHMRMIFELAAELAPQISQYQ
jgi:hypothetical protein